MHVFVCVRVSQVVCLKVNSNPIIIAAAPRTFYHFWYSDLFPRLTHGTDTDVSSPLLWVNGIILIEALGIVAHLRPFCGQYTWTKSLSGLNISIWFIMYHKCGQKIFGEIKKTKSSNLQSYNPDFSCWYPCVRDALHHLITTAIAPAVPPSHFDAATFKDSLKHQTGAL